MSPTPLAASVARKNPFAASHSPPAVYVFCAAVILRLLPLVDAAPQFADVTAILAYPVPVTSVQPTGTAPPVAVRAGTVDAVWDENSPRYKFAGGVPVSLNTMSRM